MTEKHLQAACATLDIDIISLDLSVQYVHITLVTIGSLTIILHDTIRRLPFKLRYVTIGQALQRGVYFEISLAPVLRGISERQSQLVERVN